MSASSPARGDLTVWLRDLLRDHDLVVDVIDAPAQGGWNDDPQSPGSYFTQYLTIAPMEAVDPSGSLGDPATEWNLPYSITSVGVTPVQVEGQADKARRIVNEIGRVFVDLGGEKWRVFDARIKSVGAVVKNFDVRPAEFTQRDTVMVRISKGRT